MAEKDMPEVAVPEDWKQEETAGRIPAMEAPQPVAPAVEKEPAIGNAVCYVVEAGKMLEAAINAVFADAEGKPNGKLELRVLDPENAQGHFRASPVEHDAGKSPGTWHWSNE